jgi:hypothetical protein
MDDGKPGEIGLLPVYLRSVNGMANGQGLPEPPPPPPL